MDDQSGATQPNVQTQQLNEEGDELQLFDKIFATREELLNATRCFYSSKGYALSVKSFRKDKYVTIGCDRGGTYRDRINIPIEHRQRNTSTRLINCPFDIQGKVQDDGFWKIVMRNESHNHEASTDMCGHPSVRQFSKEEISSIDDMTKSGIAPRQILSSLRRKNPNLQAISRNIYNMKVKIKKDTLAGRAEIQVLFEELGKGDFKFDIQRDDEGHLTHLFFAHPTSIKLSRSYSTVFVMDSTYKTNRYRMPLLEIIGVTSFNTSFRSCFVFLKNERQEDYIWALKMFQKSLGQTQEPSVIVTDRELALMNAIKVVFPGTVNLLCVWHIKTNLLANCKPQFGRLDEWDGFLSSWNEVINCETETKFEEAWQEFELSYKEKSSVLSYIKRTWLPYKEYFVEAWSGKHLHFNNRVTSRAEGAHSKLKKYLMVSNGDLRTVKEKMCLMLENEFKEIKTQLARERLHIPHNCNIPFFKELLTRVSFFALKELNKQIDMAKKGLMEFTCTGHYTSTMGLPCVHMMNGWRDTILPLEAIHSQWRIDTRATFLLEDIPDDEQGALEKLLHELHENYQNWPIIEKENARKNISQVINGQQLLFEPVVQPSKGRPAKSRKRKASSSTRRDPSRFEIVEASQSCASCQNGRHDILQCPRKMNANLVSDNGNSMGIDLNLVPPFNEDFPRNF